MLAPQIDPVALQIGPLAIHWYGLMYVCGFSAVWFLVRKQLMEQNLWNKAITADQYEGLFTTLILGVILGGRIGYVLFYNFGYYVSHPIEIFYVWQGGMSFHGGLLGPMLLGWWYCHKHDLPLMQLMDRFFVVAPIGLAFGRMGNFINGELWGRIVTAPAEVPWAMIFPAAGPEPRHPSQLYEMTLEGIVLFLVLWFTRKHEWPTGSRVALFLTGYGIARTICENFRQPDAHIGYLYGPITEGMLLSAPMILVGAAWLIYLFRKKSVE